MEIETVMNNLNKRMTYTEIAEKAGVSRNTVYNARKTPKKATLKTLEKIFSAMGYKIVFSLVEVTDEL
jgi:DNA-binding phage protein